MKYFDAHNHAHDETLLPFRDKIDGQLRAIGLETAVVNGTCEADWEEVLAQAAQYPWWKPSLGLHPWDVGNRGANWAETLAARLEAHPGVAVGEIGLDRWILERARPDDPRLRGLRRAPLDEQRDVFRFQLQLAARLRRPASVHGLEAWGALREDLEAIPLPQGFLLHAYSGPVEMVPVFAELGAYFSFNGAFLADQKLRQRETFRAVPADRLLVETDSPAMTPPTAWRTHKLPRLASGDELNHPGNIEAVYTGLAAYLGEPLADLAQRVEANFLRWFRFA